jgi:hypothetical protein
MPITLRPTGKIHSAPRHAFACNRSPDQGKTPLWYVGFVGRHWGGFASRMIPRSPLARSASVAPAGPTDEVCIFAYQFSTRRRLISFRMKPYQFVI